MMFKHQTPHNDVPNKFIILENWFFSRKKKKNPLGLDEFSKDC